MKRVFGFLAGLVAACSVSSSNEGPRENHGQRGQSAGGEGDRNAAPPAEGAASAAVRFVALGDAGMANSGQKRVAEAMGKKCAESGCDFAVLLGDNFYNDGVGSVNDPQWKTRFEDIYRDLDLPFYAILGNHDYGGDGAGYEGKRAAVQVAYAKQSTRWKMPDKYYRFTAGNAEFFALDTNEQMYLAAGDQRKTVAGWIGQSLATWKIALGHHPILSNGPHGNAGAYEGIPFLPIVSGAGVKDFMEEVICGKVDLYLCGHDHSRQYLGETCKGTELVVSGAGAKATRLNEKNPSRFQSLEVGFLYVRIEGNTLTAEFVDGEGKADFTRVLTR
jgi:3',5'-cyclic AMP phosphodiesterase CpdA